MQAGHKYYASAADAHFHHFIPPCLALSVINNCYTKEDSESDDSFTIVALPTDKPIPGNNMASSAEQVSQTQSARQVPNHRPYNSNPTGRSWRGRGGPRHNGNQSNSDRGSLENPRAARGRGSRDHNIQGRGRNQVSSNPQPPTPLLQPPPSLAGGGTFGVHPTKDAESAEGEVASTQPHGEVDNDAEVCFICASSVMHNAIAPCNHRTCHICALRLRALYKTRACAHCRVRYASSSPQAFED